MSTLTQFDLDFSGRLPASAQIGMAKADENANERWKHMWDAIVVAVARKKRELTSDDVLEEYETLNHPPGTHNLAAIGPAMKRAWKMGVLERTDRVVRSIRAEKNGNRHNVWLSKYYEGAK
jgi:hypothetical protein